MEVKWKMKALPTKCLKDLVPGETFQPMPFDTPNLCMRLAVGSQEPVILKSRTAGTNVYYVDLLAGTLHTAHCTWEVLPIKAHAVAEELE